MRPDQVLSWLYRLIDVLTYLLTWSCLIGVRKDVCSFPGFQLELEKVGWKIVNLNKNWECECCIYFFCPGSLFFLSSSRQSRQRSRNLPLFYHWIAVQTRWPCDWRQHTTHVLAGSCVPHLGFISCDIHMLFMLCPLLHILFSFKCSFIMFNSIYHKIHISVFLMIYINFYERQLCWST